MASKRPSEQNVVAIIQARMGSTRYPGKVLADLQGRPVLDWVVEAVKRVDGVDEIVVATTTNSEDQVIEEWCLRESVNCFRGEPLDVLKRYADCAAKYRATHVVRITADCPLLDSETVSTVLREGLQSGADYFGLDGGFPDGFDCEGFTVKALEKAHSQSTESLDREHVTYFFKRNPDVFVIHPVRIFSGLTQVRLTVDQKEDLDFLGNLLGRVGFEGARPSTSSILSAYASLELKEISNRHIRRNESMP